MSDTTYKCGNCGHESNLKPKLCTKCGSVDTYSEYVPPSRGKKKKIQNPHNQKLVNQGKQVALHISEVSGEKAEKVSTGIGELNNVLGGGLAKGSASLLGGEPGVGKSTLLMELAMRMSQGMNVLYVSYEENPDQVKDRANRIGVDAGNLFLVFENDIHEIIGTHRHSTRPAVIIIDSLNKMFNPDLPSRAGSPIQMSYCENKLIELAKSTGIIVLMIAQVNKAGDIKGQQDVIHDADLILYMENDITQTFRLLRATKYRFGSTDNVAVFKMTESGLEEVPNPSAEFLSERDPNAMGSSITAVLDGIRANMIETQALVTRTGGAYPYRKALGVDQNRVGMICDVMTSHLRAYADLSERNVRVNAVSGVRVAETASDLAVASAIFSSHNRVPVPPDVVAIGEIKLTGGLHKVPFIEKRIAEAKRMGFRRAVVPMLGNNPNIPEGIIVHEARNLDDALRKIFYEVSFDDRFGRTSDESSSDN